MNDQSRWYALQTMPKHEDIVASLLRYKGYEQYVPEYPAASAQKKRPVRTPKLFPGYVFCRFDYASSGCVGVGTGVVSTPGVVRIVGGRPPIPVPEQELDAIRRALDSHLQANPWPYLRVGEKVVIETGPLRGISGIIACTDRIHRLVLSVELLRRSVAVTVPAEWVSTACALGEAIYHAKTGGCGLSQAHQ